MDEGSRKIIQEKLLLLGTKGFANGVVNDQKENR